MDKRQLDVFRAAFKRANHGKLDLPRDTEAGKIYDMECYPDGMRNGYSARFFIAQNENGEYFLELLGSSDYASWHKHIDRHGKISDLENYEGQFGRNEYPDDPERTEKERTTIQEHNDRLHRHLLQKGLEPDLDNEEFEKNHVIRIRNYGF